MRVAAGLVAFAALSGCLHNPKLGWDCRATIDRGAVRATAYYYLDASGRLVNATTDWRHSETADQPGLHSTWEGASPQVDWQRGKAYLMLSTDPNPSFAKHRLELHGPHGRPLTGALDRGPMSFITLSWPRLLELGSTEPLTLVLKSEAGIERKRVPLSRDLLTVGLAAAEQAAGQASHKATDFRKYCERSPEITPT